MEELKTQLQKNKQEHLLDFYPTLTESEQQVLLSNLKQIDFDRVASIFTTATSPPASKSSQQPSPLPLDLVDSTLSSSTEKIGNWKKTGMDLIAKGQVGVILLAGGQGTRLGSSAPKGCYNINLPSQKSLFELQGERILKLQMLAEKEYKIGKVVIPWYVMTSGPTRAATESFFRERKFFGLEEENVFFFNQGVLPAFTPEGKIFMESKTCPAFSPDGNGGIYAALRSEGVIQDLEKRKIPFVHVYCVDNCLVKVADPVFIGYCVGKNADAGCKVVPKTKPSEAVGVICLKNGKPCVVEYSEIDKELTEARHDKTGALLFNAANIANHFFTTEFLKNIKDFEGELEYHIARKKIKHIGPNGDLVAPTQNNGIKLELFIFDVLPFSKRFVVLETPRKDEFSPLKNAPGSIDGDSPDTSRADIMAQHVRYVEQAGGIVSAGTGEYPILEISPLVSYDGEGLESLAGKTITPPKLISSINDLENI